MNSTAPPVDTDKPPNASEALPSRRERPPITEGEDRPFDECCDASESFSNGDSPQIKTIEEKELDHKHKVEDYKNIVGGTLLIVCFLIIVCFALMDAQSEITSTLFTGAFEFAKTIATAVIGYLFATNIKTK